ncbi:MAG: o-succinylbenzoate synthase [bacterium]
MNRSALAALLAENTWHLLPYHLPLRNKLTTQQGSDFLRKGLLLVWQSDVGIVYGEIAPLPGLHSESLDAAKLLVQNHFPNFIKELEASNHSWLELNYPKTLAPSVKFGFEMLAFHYQFLKEKISLAHFLKPEPSFPVPLNGLLNCSLEGLESEIQRCKIAGYKTVKIKVGRRELEEDIQRVRLVRRQWTDVEIRLDANQAWTLTEAKEVLSSLADCNLAYCEEPLQNPQELPQLRRSCEVNLALDETLWKDPELARSIQDNVHAYILKPGILGGWQETLKWIKSAKATGILPVLSSSFESGIGHLWIALLASSHVSRAPAVGLDTAFWFENDLLNPSFSSHIQNGRLILPQKWPEFFELNMNVLHAPS